MPIHHHHHLRQFDIGSGHGHQDHNGRGVRPEAIPVAQRAENIDPEVATLVSVVFVTVSPTFSGPAGGFTTILPSSANILPAPSKTPSRLPTAQAPQSIVQPEPSVVAATSQVSSAAPLQSTSPTSIAAASSVPSTTAKSDPKSLSKSLLVSVPATSAPTSIAATPTRSTPSLSAPVIATSATQSSTSEPATVSKASSNGMSSGAKAGLAIGVLLGLGLLIALLAFCYRRKKKLQQNAAYGKTEDEKNPFGDDAVAGGPGRAASTRSNIAPSPPQLSLRPESQFRPELPGQPKNTSLLDVTNPSAAAASNRNNATSPKNHDLEMAQLQADYPSNPFETIPGTPGSSPSPVISPGQEVPAPLRVRTPTPEGAALAAGAGTALGAAAAITGQRHNAPKPLDLKHNNPAPPDAMPSPAGTEFSMTSVSSESMANGPAPTNVHRVQLDFKPSMEDELELRAGQLVKLLHEYDDGWALCIRLDRSQQGVAPRTCLSMRPVKPRLNGNPRGAAPRGIPSPSLRGPPQQRSMSPVAHTGSPDPLNRVPRLMSPGPSRGQRSMSPGPYGGGPQRPVPSPGGKRRSNSASDVRERRNSPPGPSPMNPNAQIISRGMQGVQKGPSQLQAFAPPRQSPAHVMQRKPVPGQAM